MCMVMDDVGDFGGGGELGVGFWVVVVVRGVVGGAGQMGYLMKDSSSCPRSLVYFWDVYVCMYVCMLSESSN